MSFNNYNSQWQQPQKQFTQYPKQNNGYNKRGGYSEKPQQETPTDEQMEECLKRGCGKKLVSKKGNPYFSCKGCNYFKMLENENKNTGHSAGWAGVPSPLTREEVQEMLNKQTEVLLSSIAELNAQSALYSNEEEQMNNREGWTLAMEHQ